MADVIEASFDITFQYPLCTAMKIKILATDEHGQTRTKHDIFIVSGRGRRSKPS
jgi:hypothetical protein